MPRGSYSVLQQFTSSEPLSKTNSSRQAGRPLYASIYTFLALVIVSHGGCDKDRPRTSEEPDYHALAYEAFDQTRDGGWRKIAKAGEYLKAARSIEDYAKRRADLRSWQRINLSFHAGQLYAFAGDNETAIKRFSDAMNANEAKDSPIRWNAYVDATIAFLKKDRERILERRHEIACGPNLDGEIPNLDVVDRLIEGFDKSYAEAYGER